MRKLFLFGGAAALAYLMGKAKTRAARDVAVRDGRRGIGLTDILDVMLAPRWLKPVVLVRAAAQRRQPAQRG